MAGLRAALGDCSGGGPDSATAPPVGAQVERLRRWLEPVVRRRYDAAAARCGDLEVNVPLRYHHHRHRLDDRHSYAPLSRFLSPDVRALMDSEHAEAPSGEPFAETPPGEEDGVAAVDRFLAGLWS